MSGLGRKIFTRETLSSADMNGYLMDQVVMHFASAAARVAALAAPSEGMVSTVNGRRTVDRANAAGVWVPLGQAVSTYTGCDTGIGTSLVAGAIRGLHPATSITQPFGAGVPFVGFGVAVLNVSIAVPSEVALAMLGDPNNAGVLQARSQNASGSGETRTLIAPAIIDSGAADALSYQPIIRCLSGAVTPSADVRLSFSAGLVWPK